MSASSSSKETETYVRVFVVPGAKKEIFLKERDDAFTVHVKEEARRNMANKRVQEILAHHFKTAVGNVRLVTGHRSPHKMFSIEHEA